MKGKVLAPSAIAGLADRLSTFRVENFSQLDRQATIRSLQDALAVAIAGGRTVESSARRDRVYGRSGRSTVLGTAFGTNPTDAAWLNGCSMVNLELDSGNRFAGGHPACHVLPALLAVAEAGNATGSEFMTAFVVGHEAASRLGTATRLHPGVHAHGTWGAAGAAAAVAMLETGEAKGIACAIDAASAMAIAAPFEAAISGHSVRDGWVGLANVAGMYASALGHEGEISGIGDYSLGRILGTCDWSALQPTGPLEITRDYYKIHSCCAYAHSAVDATISIHNAHPEIDFAEEITKVEIETNLLGARISGQGVGSRLAAMFSLPFIIATSLLAGRCTPTQFSTTARTCDTVLNLMGKVEVRHDPKLDERLPIERASKVTLTTVRGEKYSEYRANAVGEFDTFPLTDLDLKTKAKQLIGNDEAERLFASVHNLADQPNLSHLTEVVKQIGESLEDRQQTIG